MSGGANKPLVANGTTHPDTVTVRLLSPVGTVTVWELATGEWHWEVRQGFMLLQIGTAESRQLALEAAKTWAEENR